MPRGFTPQEKQLISEQLLDQGHKQFSTFGLKKTSVDSLAAAAGISKGAFYLFYPSKEALFMEVVERAEEKFRQEVLASIEQPAATPRTRLLAVLKLSFSLWKTIPLLQVFTSTDYRSLARTIPPETIQAHSRSDRAFVVELVSRCQKAEIPIQAPVDQIGGLLYALFFTSLHEDDIQQISASGAMDILLDLVAAFCLGEVEVQKFPPTAMGSIQ